MVTTSRVEGGGEGRGGGGEEEGGRGADWQGVRVWRAFTKSRMVYWWGCGARSGGGVVLTGRGVGPEVGAVSVGARELGLPENRVVTLGEYGFRGSEVGIVGDELCSK